ncbi:hypothetical protein JRQ81_010706 [Phrynocephalus forsythii]|uniref:Uncharacterized protein n=1 Tax=Phrynocephalus forsythii TaxID=171643 RepID=A0A9Q0X912_9SAUR|nr:hypothetical protein JRQ81_010706 [Phrynocephalus forsythii]
MESEKGLQVHLGATLRAVAFSLPLVPEDQKPDRLPEWAEPAGGLPLRAEDGQPRQLRVPPEQGLQRGPGGRQQHECGQRRLQEPHKRHDGQEPGVPLPSRLHQQRRRQLRLQVEDHQ